MYFATISRTDETKNEMMYHTSQYKFESFDKLMTFLVWDWKKYLIYDDAWIKFCAFQNDLVQEFNETPLDEDVVKVKNIKIDNVEYIFCFTRSKTND